MTTLAATLHLDRCLLMEISTDPNVVPVRIVSGTAGSASAGGGASMGKVDSYVRDGEFRKYGNGRTRLITGPNSTRTQTYALRLLEPDQVAQLRSLVGKTVLYCDTYGRRIFGGFLAMSVANIPFSTLADASIVLTSVTHSEEV